MITADARLINGLEKTLIANRKIVCTYVSAKSVLIITLILDKQYKNTTTECQPIGKNIEKYISSALSMHAYDVDDGELDLKDFEVAVVSKVPPRRLNREEFIFIDKFQTKTKGLNRYQVVSI